MHPHHASQLSELTKNEFLQLVSKYNPNVIGEIGLDYFRNISTPEEQMHAFEIQLQAAIDLELPVFLHQRDSHDDFLKIFRSRQRKNIRNERKKISELGITFSVKDSDNISRSDWETFYYFYRNTYDQRLQRPYLNKDFFNLVHKSKNTLNPVIFFAHLNDEIIAGSLCYKDKNNLYGRHWGAKYDIDSLHFECCYYQGIDYCIKNGLKEFDPGVQGEHKIRRGFEPITTFSYHYILRKDFKDAILDFCNREKIENKRYLEACKRYTPFNKEYKI